MVSERKTAVGRVGDVQPPEKQAIRRRTVVKGQRMHRS
jgi:hypothetical protein